MDVASFLKAKAPIRITIVGWSVFRSTMFFHRVSTDVSTIIKWVSEGVRGYQGVSRSVKMYQKASSIQSIKIIKVAKVMKKINGLT